MIGKGGKNYYTKNQRRDRNIASEVKALTFLNQKIKVLPPEHWKFQTGEPKRYFVPEYNNKNWKLSEFILQLHDTVINAVKKRVNTDLPVGVIYSIVQLF